MSSFKFVDVIKQLTEANKKLSEELVFIRERMKMFTEFKFIFDLNSNKIKQSLDSNEWQKFEKVLTKINEIRDIRDTSNDNCVLDVNTGQTHPQQPQETNEEVIQEVNEGSDEQKPKRKLTKLSDDVKHKKLMKRKITSRTSDERSDRKYKSGFDRCYKKCERKTDLMSHEKSDHSKRDKYQCEYPKCGFWTNSIEAFEKHIYTHIDGYDLSSQTYVCDHEGCRFTADSEARLNMHKKKHSNHRPFECTVEGCDKRFKRDKNLKNHLELHKK